MSLLCRPRDAGTFPWFHHCGATIESGDDAPVGHHGGVGGAIIGNQLRKMLGRERDTVRKILGSLLSPLLEPHRG